MVRLTKWALLRGFFGRGSPVSEDNEIDVAKEVIDKPWKWEDLAQVHTAHPDLDVDDALDARPQRNS